MSASVTWAGSRRGGTVADFGVVSVHSAGHHLAARAHFVAELITRIHLPIERDFDTRVGALRVTLYPDHRSFSSALQRQDHVLPQSILDNTSSVIHGRLLLGPISEDYLAHNLVHVYAEWVMDRLTRNRTDNLPANPWLYDGLAEYEAYRYAPEQLTCSLHSRPPIDITRLVRATQWLGMRAGPLGPLQYCLAYVEVRTLVRRDGWRCITRTLKSLGWWRAGCALLGIRSRLRCGLPSG